MKDYNVTNEFGVMPDETPSREENKYYFDNPQPLETATVNEFAEDNKKPKSKNKGIATTLLAGFLATTVAVTAGATALASVNKATVDLREFGGALTGDYPSIFYHVEVDSDVSLKCVLYNDFTRREATLVNGSNSGSFDNLKDGMEYTFVVVGTGIISDKIFIKRNILLDAENS